LIVAFRDVWALSVVFRDVWVLIVFDLVRLFFGTRDRGGSFLEFEEDLCEEVRVLRLTSWGGEIGSSKSWLLIFLFLVERCDEVALEVFV